MAKNRDDGFDEIRLPAKAVNGLQKMNELKRSEQFDVAFLQAMFIGFCTLKKVKDEGVIDENILNVAEGELSIRIIILYSYFLNYF